LALVTVLLAPRTKLIHKSTPICSPLAVVIQYLFLTEQFI